MNEKAFSVHDDPTSWFVDYIGNFSALEIQELAFMYFLKCF